MTLPNFYTKIFFKNKFGSVKLIPYICLMKKYIVTFGFYSDEGYTTGKSKPIQAENADEAAIMLKDQFESYEGIPCTIISVNEA